MNDNEKATGQKTEVVVSRSTGLVASPLDPSAMLPSCPSDRPMTTWALDTMEGRIRLQNVLCGETVPLWDLCDKEPFEVSVSDVCVRYVERVVDEQTGEIKAGPMIYLVGPDGVFTTSSPSAIRALIMTEACGLPAPWCPPMQFRAQRARSRNKREYLTIVCIGQEQLNKE